MTGNLLRAPRAYDGSERQSSPIVHWLLGDMQTIGRQGENVVPQRLDTGKHMGYNL